MKKALAVFALLLATLCLSIGYAGVVDSLFISGSLDIQSQYDVYITEINPEQSEGVTVSSYFSTVMTAKISGSGRAEFEITVKNASDKTYVYERVVDGKSAGIDGVYNGDGVEYTVTGVSALDELGAGQSLTIGLTLNVASGVTTDNFVLKFNFIEKTGTEILPGDPDPEPAPEPDTPSPDPDVPDPPAPDNPDNDDILHSDFLGLVEALLSENPNCLNDSNVIYNAVMESLNSGKRPAGDPPILHCHVKSISGGTMTDITETANSNLTSNLHFIFEADETNENRLFLYMYYEEDCTSSKLGEEILVYKQVVTRGADGIWIANGTYIGKATIANIYGGGKNGKDALTINPYTWVATSSSGAEE